MRKCVGLRGKLRGVGYAQKLRAGAGGERVQLSAHLIAGAAGDAGVDFVEDGGFIAVAEHAFHRQHDAGQLAAAGDLAQRARRFAGVGGDEEFDLIRAGSDRSPTA